MRHSLCLVAAVLANWSIVSCAAVAMAGMENHRTSCLSGSDLRDIEVLSAGAGCELAYSKSLKTTVVASARQGDAYCDAARQRIVAKLERAGFYCVADSAAEAMPYAMDKLYRSRLLTLRAFVLIFRDEHKGAYPRKLQELAPEYHSAPIGIMRTGAHPPTMEVSAYDGSVCSADGKLDRSRVRDTGGWGYVGDPAASCAGTVFIDCTHTDSEGKVWAAY
ncbi:MAG: hypothetical protein A2X36_14380 [Elusimicrobia bacterium GWA2_69_24]|nr:MAG: hypothetical protein A2X36_14380 [Elusimicrobia bacterium GWA2_69_24]HBL18420.1 hypothetical protein [Elusimicrobiota bacterium]